MPLETAYLLPLHHKQHNSTALHRYLPHLADLGTPIAALARAPSGPRLRRQSEQYCGPTSPRPFVFCAAFSLLAHPRGSREFLSRAQAVLRESDRVWATLWPVGPHHSIPASRAILVSCALSAATNLPRMIWHWAYRVLGPSPRGTYQPARDRVAATPPGVLPTTPAPGLSPSSPLPHCLHTRGGRGSS